MRNHSGITRMDWAHCSLLDQQLYSLQKAGAEKYIFWNFDNP